MAYDLRKRGLRVQTQIPISVTWANIRLELGFRADMIVEGEVVVELKSVDAIAPVHKKQLLTYSRLTDKRVGLLINFNVALLKDEITRIVNELEDETHAETRVPKNEHC